MDPTRFDRLTRTLSLAASRRGTLAALLSAALAGTAGLTAAKKKSRKGKVKAKPAARVSAEAVDCFSPGPSANMSGCNYNNEDFAGADLSSSRMVGTRFRGANLCGANLSSSTLRNADFRGFAAPGNATNLFRADLSSSACGGVLFNARTLFCRTKTCNGAFRDDDCPEGIDPEDVCCSDPDCGPEQVCAGGICIPISTGTLVIEGGSAGCVNVFGAGLDPGSLATAAALGSCSATFTTLVGFDGSVAFQVCPAVDFCPNCLGAVVDGVAAVGLANGLLVTSAPFVLSPPVQCLV